MLSPDTLVNGLKKMRNVSQMFFVKYAEPNKINPEISFSSKKKTALDCFSYAISTINSMPDLMKRSWYNFTSFGIASLKDSEIDTLVKASLESSNLYIQKHLQQEMIEQAETDQEKELMKIIYKPSMNKITMENNFNEQYRV
tara:strand:+ start:21 stop:446 length:426 start_codon:yes stop_codon:yes gene_type:complete